MSEKTQGTTARLREKMLARYGDEDHHKHNKLHSTYRRHWRSHPVQVINGFDEKPEINQPTGLKRTLNLQKIRKRLDGRRYH